jgi:hypothetical protein
MGRANKMSGIHACVFDAYGTLFDYASAAAKCEDRLGGKLVPFTTLWRDKQLQYSWLRAAQYCHVWTAPALQGFCRRLTVVGCCHSRPSVANSDARGREPRSQT